MVLCRYPLPAKPLQCYYHDRLIDMSNPEFPNAVFYCDAGFMMDSKSMYRGKANLASYGIHGYTYVTEEPKKGTGSPKVIPTNDGYKDKADSANYDKVTVGEYVDIVAGIPPGTRPYASSNQAELRAYIETLKWTLSEGKELTNIKIYSDSKYTVQGTNDWVDKWKINGWRNTTGAEIKYRDMWIEASDLTQLVKRQCVDGFSLEWLRGHAGHVGNEAADALATKGLALAANGITEAKSRLSPPQGYWKTDNDSPRILQSPRWYFSTTDRDYVDTLDGRYTYFIGCHGSKDKETELAGKKYADNFLGVVKVMEPDPVMEYVRDLYLKADEKALSNLVITHLDALFSPKQYRELKELGWDFTLDATDKIRKLNSVGGILVEEMVPMGQGFRLVDVWKMLNKLLNEVRTGEGHFTRFDITTLFYVKDEKKDVWKIKPEMTQLVKHVDVIAPFNLAKANEPAQMESSKVRLIMGSDIINRNALSAISAEVESIQLITWRESDKVGRYATYIQLLNGDSGLWCRYDANSMIFK